METKVCKYCGKELPITEFRKGKAHGVEFVTSVCNRKLEFVGYVEFKNGETEGKQKFTACNFSELYTKIAHFCMSIEDYEKE